MVDSFFVKNPSRISALMVIMTLCLMVYNYAEYKVRKALHESGETIPDQKNKPTSRPTLKWIFQLMEGVNVVHIDEGKKVRNLITNMNEVRLKIIRLLGEWAKINYGLS